MADRFDCACVLCVVLLVFFITGLLFFMEATMADGFGFWIFFLVKCGVDE